jgi:hypothetical protein
MRKRRKDRSTGQRELKRPVKAADLTKGAKRNNRVQREKKKEKKKKRNWFGL